MTDGRASASGEPGFDEIYARAVGSDLNAIPWAALAPQRRALVAWLDRQDRPGPPGHRDRPSPPGRQGQPGPRPALGCTALIVACGPRW